jgi:acetaldehyde dehydrogenase
MTQRRRLEAAVLGAGLIGIDLVNKINHSELLHCGLVVGRETTTVGLHRAAEMGCETFTGGIESLVESGRRFDIVFDASNAAVHTATWQRLADTGAMLVDLTPSRLGTTIVPTMNRTEAETAQHVSLVSCGGQAAIPLLRAISEYVTPEYVEVVTTAASVTTGRATRLNLDEYIAVTQDAIRDFSGAKDTKVLANISPAVPPPPFRVVITVEAPTERLGGIQERVEAEAEAVRAFAPGYTVSSCVVTEERVRIAVEVTARGSRIPEYAGNLDIINAAAVLLAERYAVARTEART